MHIAAKMVREEELLRLLLTGLTLKECAPMLSLHVSTVRNYARAPLFLQKLRDLSTVVYERVDAELQARTDVITERLQEASAAALEEMIKLAKEGKQEGIRLKASQDLMDRDSRISRTRKIEGTQEHAFMNPLQLQHMAMTARQVDQAEVVATLPLPQASEDDEHAA